MQVDFSKDDLEMIMKWRVELDSTIPATLADGELYNRLLSHYRSAEELEGIDLNDCGDACKL